MTAPHKTILILGGTSDIGRAIALRFSAEGWGVQLAGRSVSDLQREALDIAARTGVTPSLHAFDVLDLAQFGGFIDRLDPLPTAVVSVIGLLGEQARAETDPDHAVTVMRSNYEGPALLFDLFATRFLARGHGSLIGVSSVAGDRGRASNYIYGSAKAGFSAFLSGLRNRLAKQNIHVMTVKPGFVRTKMTAGMKLPGPITALPVDVADAIFAGLEKGRDVIYVRPIWRLIMLIITAIPEAIFKKLSL